MAQTKSPTRKPRKSQARSQTQARSRAKPKTNSSSKPKARSTNSHSQKSKARSSKPKTALPDKAKAAGESVEETAKDAGRAVGRAASKAKVPLMAGGAAVAGMAGGLALGARQAHRHRSIRRIDSDGVAKAARKVGDVGMQIGELALEGRRAREASNGKAHRSPVEVVLEGLTARRRQG